MRDVSAHMNRLTAEDAVGQLVERRGRMAQLGSENGRVMLDWVAALPRMLDRPEVLQEIEAQAGSILDRGIRYVIWAGMGGSVMSVRVLADVLQWPPALTILPLDSTDPAALNAVVERLARHKGTPVDHLREDRDTLRGLFADVLMVSVAMGMTSEEPITHLEWFVDLLRIADLPAGEHTMVMALPGSYLERFAHDNELPVFPLQPDGGSGTGGRMSAPSTQVFLLPAALLLRAAGEERGTLPALFARVLRTFDFGSERGSSDGRRIAVTMADAAQRGVCRLLLGVSPIATPLVGWVEQLMEESLGKGGQGVLVFDARATPWMQGAPGTISIENAWNLGAEDVRWPAWQGLFRLAESFLRWQLVMALYGYLFDIPFAGQPAVENYKSRARALREEGNPLGAVKDWRPRIESEGICLLLPPQATPEESPERSVAGSLRLFHFTHEMHYLDVTLNGEWPANVERTVGAIVAAAAQRLQTCYKVRRAPACYHSTEQSEMDGPPGVFSIRIVTREHPAVVIGRYSDAFLLAQAVGTWQAMNEAGRQCYLAIFDGTPEHAAPRVVQFLEGALEV